METSYGFFEGRRPISLKGLTDAGRKKPFRQYLNVPAIIGVLVSKRIATLYELQTVYGVKDSYDMLEIVNVDDYNTALANQD